MISKLSIQKVIAASSLSLFVGKISSLHSAKESMSFCAGSLLSTRFLEAFQIFVAVCFKYHIRVNNFKNSFLIIYIKYDNYKFINLMDTQIVFSPYQQKMSHSKNPFQLQIPGDYEQQPQSSSEQDREYWGEHRVTLIAYEAQYIYRKKLLENDKEQSNNNKETKPSRKKISLQYESGFLSVSDQQPKQIDLEKLIKGFENLAWLFQKQKEQNYLYVREMVKIMLELKHSCILEQFCAIYDMIIKELRIIEFGSVKKQQQRGEWMKKSREKIVEEIKVKGQKFEYFDDYLKSDEKETQKLIEVELYCFVAELFNFNINQYYSQAFSVVTQGKPHKKVKVN